MCEPVKLATALAAKRPMQPTGAVLQQVGEKHLGTLSRYWGATERGWGHEERAASTILVASSMTNTGEPARDGKERGKEAGATRTERSEALQAVRWGRGVGVWESHRHGEAAIRSLEMAEMPGMRGRDC